MPCTGAISQRGILLSINLVLKMSNPFDWKSSFLQSITGKQKRLFPSNMIYFEIFRWKSGKSEIIFPPTWSNLLGFYSKRTHEIYFRVRTQGKNFLRTYFFFLSLYFSILYIGQAEAVSQILLSVIHAPSNNPTKQGFILLLVIRAPL